MKSYRNKYYICIRVTKNKQRMYKIISTCKGGGYMYCRTIPLHPKRNSNGLYPLHRVVMENKLNRNLLSSEDVHHKDEDKTNNNPDNLEVLTKSEHGKLHSKIIDNVNLSCPNCQENISIKPHEYRLRINRNKSKEIFCSRSCATIYNNI